MDLTFSGRATTHYQAVRLVEHYRLFAAGSRFCVGSTSWRMNPRKDPSCGNRARAEFRNIALAEDGTTEIELDDRYRFGEPFDIEFSQHGFIVWSASSIHVAKRTRLGPHSEPTVLAPLVDELEFASLPAGTTLAVAGHLPFEPLSIAAVAAIEHGAPVAGLLDYDQFPVDGHGWSAAPAERPTVRLIYW